MQQVTYESDEQFQGLNAEQQADILELTLKNCNDVNLLSEFTNLTNLSIKASKTSTIPPLTKLQQLSILEFSLCPQLTELNSISNCQLISVIRLHKLDIQSIDVLLKFPLLQKLTISCCLKIQKLSDLGQCPKLVELSCISLPISELDFLQKLPQLVHLELDSCKNINDITYLEYCRGIKTLKLISLKINDISSIINARKLSTLHIEFKTSGLLKFNCKIIEDASKTQDHLNKWSTTEKYKSYITHNNDIIQAATELYDNLTESKRNNNDYDKDDNNNTATEKPQLNNDIQQHITHEAQPKTAPPNVEQITNTHSTPEKVTQQNIINEPQKEQNNISDNDHLLYDQFLEQIQYKNEIKCQLRQEMKQQIQFQKKLNDNLVLYQNIQSQIKQQVFVEQPPQNDKIEKMESIQQVIETSMQKQLQQHQQQLQDLVRAEVGEKIMKLQTQMEQLVKQSNNQAQKPIVEIDCDELLTSRNRRSKK